MINDDDPAADEEFDRMMLELEEDEHRVERSHADEAYRFRDRGAFGHHYSVLIERRGDQIMLVAEACPEMYGPTRKVARPLMPPEWERLQAALDRAGFWAMPEQHDRWGFDGWSWTVEARQDGRYHSSTCWCPEPGEPLHDLGLVFLELAGFDPREQGDAT